jgi:hypothetical protein
MDLKKQLKGIALPIIKGLALPVVIFGVAMFVLKGFSFGGRESEPQQMVMVDTSKLIRAASQNLAANAKGEVLISALKIEAYSNSLAEALRAFATQNRYLVFTSNQVYGDLPNKTEEFIAYVEQGRQK